MLLSMRSVIAKPLVTFVCNALVSPPRPTTLERVAFLTILCTLRTFWRNTSCASFKSASRPDARA